MLKTSLIRRARKNNWLESHIWHSKRFIMKKKFEYTIAYKRRDKGFKACYRYAKNDGCIYDSSYYNYLFLRTNKNQTNQKHQMHNLFKKIIKAFTIDQDLADKNYKDFENFKNYNLNFYNLLTGRLIGPVDLIVLNSIISIRFHPLMKAEMIESFKNFNLNNINYSDNADYSHYFNDSSNSFSLIGPRCGSVLYKIIKSLTFTEDYCLNNLLNSMTEFEFEKQLHYLKDNKVILFKLRKPKSQFKMNELIFNQITKQINQSQFSNEANEDYPMKSSFSDQISEINQKNASDDFNDNFFSFFKKSKELKEIDLSKIESKSREVEINLSTERTVYQHRKKVNLDSLNKKIRDSIKNDYNKNKNLKIQTKRLSQLKSNDNEIKKEIEINLHNKTSSLEELKKISSSDEETYFILIKQNICLENMNQPIFHLIFPEGFSVDLLRRFVYLQLRAIGLSEFNFYLTESKKLIFPNDYPSTLSYQKYIKEKCIRKIKKYCKYPASKRVNYQKIGNPFPFYSAWRKILQNTSNNSDSKFEINNFNENIEIVCDLQDTTKIMNQFKIQKILNPSYKNFIIPILIFMTGKGIPRYNSLICMPTHDDMITYINRKKANINRENYLEKIMQMRDTDCPSEKINFLNDIYRLKTEKIIEPIQKVQVKNKVFNLEFNTLSSMYNNFSDRIYDNPNPNHSQAILKYSTEILEHDLTIKLPLQVSRKIIGFVTTGQYSYSESKGIGRGYIDVKSYESLVNLKTEFNSDDLILLIRHKNSRIYYPSKIHLLSI